MLRVFAYLTALSLAAQAQWTTSHIQGSPEAPKPYVPEQVFTQIALNDGLEMQMVPGAGRFAAVEKNGKIWTFKDSPDTTKKDLLIDLKPDHPALSYGYGIAFHPQWRENGFVFITYVEGDKNPDGSKLSRFKLTQQDPPVLDPKSETVLLTWLSGGHNGAHLQFGPDGMLYCTTGDATAPSPPDSLKTGQDLSDFLSSILRIDVDHEENGKAYAIPKDNPFLATPNARPEIYAFGFRNPWKISFDPKGRLWCGDVGWELWEMIHLVPKGGNHGWSTMEASQPIMPELKGPGDIIPPVAAHPHTEAASITGGYVYHGSRFPELRDAYIYGDYETGKIWALWHDGKQVTRREEIADTPHKIVSFGQSGDGELYWMNWEKDTRVYRLARNPAVGKPSEFPRKLSETGLFTDTASQTAAAGVLPFSITEPLWQDGASAERFVALPEGQKIKTTTSGNPAKPNYKVEWPVDAVLARTISLKQKRIETQVLHFDGETWNGYSYRWNDTGTEAQLVGADGEEFTIEKQPWRIHGRAECARCHTNWSGFTIGFQPDQLASIGGSKTEEAAIFDGPFFERLKTRLVASHDERASLEDRARSWLHANCAHCHRRHGGGSVQLMVNADLPTTEAMLLDEKPVRGDLSLTDARIIAPGKPHQSVLLARIARSGTGHMPMIGAREVDPDGFRLLWDWIAAGQETEGPEKVESPSDALLAANAFHRAGETFDPTLAKHANPEIACYFEGFLPHDQRVKTLGMNLDAKKLLAAKGDAKRGSELVSMTGKMAACLACHIINGSGRDFGPDLSKVGSRLSREQILESIHQPSKVISKGYETWMLTLKDGGAQTGFVVNPGDAAVTLKIPTGQPQTFARDQIRSQKVLPASLMPEGLLQAMTEQEAADLIAFLASLK
ncbi:MAG: PQQ-dependent sugar dehydrogenase [Prosthecobacter sp.]|jgi:putative heme-binding domain-containing protein|uniref:PQQ-dependent sugar dehydrogenase n=1 Tax=Prosthecobacter sp. TaxID=1965333 RepID=UPI001A0A79F2|nr:PQQ-dependent sugar dehydrogenase [Prosthecobacter sp.]MBE2286115.1 PQQ-dependent sugar dehydrogenase [Prosthecobacter sp.]